MFDCDGATPQRDFEKNEDGENRKVNIKFCGQNKDKYFCLDMNQVQKSRTKIQIVIQTETMSLKGKQMQSEELDRMKQTHRYKRRALINEDRRRWRERERE